MKKILIAIFLLTSTTAFAATGGDNVTGPTGGDNVNQNAPKVFTPISNPLRANNLEELVNSLVDLALRLGVIVATLAIIWVGFLFIVAQGEPKKISEAKQALQWVVIGITILFGSKIIIEVIRGTLGQFTRP